MPIDPRHALLLVSLALAGCQAPSQRMGEADIPAGRTLATDGIGNGGEIVFATADEAADCRAPQVWRRAGADWREGPAGAPLATTPCPTVTARAAADGRTLAVYDYSAARAELYRLKGDGFVAAGSAAITAPIGSRFPPPGPSVALSADGSRVLLGSINRNCRTPSAGERYCGVAELFERRGGGWERIATLLPPEDRDGTIRFGQSVALSADGSVALAGGTGEPGFPGALWVYPISGAEPVPTQDLSDPDDRPGFANALSWSADGSWLVVGGEQNVHLFQRQGNGFTLQKTLLPPDSSAGYFGETVALSGDGRRLLVGAPRTDCAEGDRCGVAYLFDRGKSWGLERTIKPATNVGDANFGHHLAISRDGRYLAVQGAIIHVFTLPGAP